MLCPQYLEYALISDFQSPKLWDNKFVILSQQVCDIFYGNPRNLMQITLYIKYFPPSPCYMFCFQETPPKYVSHSSWIFKSKFGVPILSSPLTSSHLLHPQSAEQSYLSYTISFFQPPGLAECPSFTCQKLYYHVERPGSFVGIPGLYTSSGTIPSLDEKPRA